jgi:ABC-type arginine/histidine transport system permease subunit
MVITVSAEALNRRPYRARLFHQAIRAISAGRVKTRWKYSTGRRSSARAANQSRAAGPWHFGQCRFLQEL